jgi:hypothetical protein
MGIKKQANRCKAQNASGTPCQAAATPGGLCFFHANPNRAVELGRVGGRSKRSSLSSDTADPLPKLDTAIAVQNAVERVIAGLYAVTIQPRVAASLGPLLHLQLRAIEANALHVRLAKLEAQLADKEAPPAEDPAG